MFDSQDMAFEFNAYHGFCADGADVRKLFVGGVSSSDQYHDNKI